MYKCGWNGCEKAYGTLNHLNAHVTMQSHGAKRTPEGKSYVAALPFFPAFGWYSFHSGIFGYDILEVVANRWIGLAPVPAR